MFLAVAPDLAPLLDPVPELAVTEHQAQLVPAGDERPVGEIMGQGDAPNGGVAIYLYRVARRTAARRASRSCASSPERRSGAPAAVW